MKHRVFIGILLVSLARATLALETGVDQAGQAIKSTLTKHIIAMATEMDLNDYKYDIEVTQIDRRLNLAYCSQPLTIDLPKTLKLGRSQIKVSCETGKKWALNIPVGLNLLANVVVLNQPVSKGLALKPHHLDYQMYNLGELNNGYFLKKELVIGKQSRRALSGGTVLNGHIILPPLLVLKGDRVMIMAKKGAMSVKMPGEALNNGREGKQIRVKNIRSNRIVRAKVVDSGLVVVNF